MFPVYVEIKGPMFAHIYKSVIYKSVKFNGICPTALLTWIEDVFNELPFPFWASKLLFLELLMLSFDQ